MSDEDDVIDDDFEEPVAEEPVITKAIVAEEIKQEPIVNNLVDSEPVVNKVKVVNKTYKVTNKLSQNIHLPNGEILHTKETLFMSSITEQLLNLKKRGFVAIVEV